MGGSTSASASASGAKTVKVGGARQRGGGAARHQCDIGGGDGGTESGALVLIPVGSAAAFAGKKNLPSGI